MRPLPLGLLGGLQGEVGHSDREGLALGVGPRTVWFPRREECALLWKEQGTRVPGAAQEPACRGLHLGFGPEAFGQTLRIRGSFPGEKAWGQEGGALQGWTGAPAGQWASCGHITCSLRL